MNQLAFRTQRLSGSIVAVFAGQPERQIGTVTKLLRPRDGKRWQVHDRAGRFVTSDHKRGDAIATLLQWDAGLQPEAGS